MKKKKDCRPYGTGVASEAENRTKQRFLSEGDGVQVDPGKEGSVAATGLARGKGT